jgi:hypothetical protein
VNTTVQQLADEVAAEREKAWANSDPTQVAVSAGVLGEEDLAAIRRAAERAGYTADNLEEITGQVAQRLIGRFQAFDDSMPSTGAD